MGVNESNGAALAVVDNTKIVESVVIHADLGELGASQRVAYYRRVCESLGLNPYTKPFDYIKLNGKLTLYATRTCTDQLAEKFHLSLEPVSVEKEDGLFQVTARATGDGRSVVNLGAVSIDGLKGDSLANAKMKAFTKAYRRATLSYCGLGWMDETEIESVPSAQRIKVTDDGEIIEAQPRAEPVQRPVARKPNHEDLFARYVALVDKAAVLGIEAAPLGLTWSDVDLTRYGQELRRRVEEAEATAED